MIIMTVNALLNIQLTWLLRAINTAFYFITKSRKPGKCLTVEEQDKVVLVYIFL